MSIWNDSSFIEQGTITWLTVMHTAQGEKR